MLQFFRVTGYRVPFSKENDKRAIFSDIDVRDLWLASFKTGYTKLYTKQATGDVMGLDFDPEQETIVLPLDGSLYDYAKPTSNVMRINYIRIDVGFATPQNYQSYFYFVDDKKVSPAYPFTNTGNTGGELPFQNKAVALMRISLDSWGTFMPPASTAAFLKKWSIVSQSTRGINGLAVSEFNAGVPFATRGAGANAAPAGRYFTYKSVGRLGRFANRPYDETPSLMEECYFVGVFAKEGGGAPLLLCRPYDVTKAPTDPSFLPLDALTTIKKLATADSITTQFVVNRDVNVGAPFNVNLVRAFLIPRKCFQPINPEEGRQNAYVIMDTDTTDGQQPAGFRALRVNGLANFVEYVHFNPTDVLEDAAEGIDTVGPVSFVDIGTLYTRLEVPAPPAGGGGIVEVTFNGQVSASGYTLLMTCGGRQVDIGGDFEIPVPVNPQLDALTRNKWSQALQGVAAVGGLAVGIASKSPTAILGGALSVGNYIAEQEEKRGAVGFIQGQGNGVTLNSYNEYGNIGPNKETMGFVFLRYEFSTNTEVEMIKRYGLIWNAPGYVRDPVAFGTDIFLNKNAGPRFNRVFIKTEAADINLGDGDIETWGISRDGPSLPAKAKKEIETLLNNGLTIYYNPKEAGDKAREGSFGY